MVLSHYCPQSQPARNYPATLNFPSKKNLFAVMQLSGEMFSPLACNPKTITIYMLGAFQLESDPCKTRAVLKSTSVF